MPVEELRRRLAPRVSELSVTLRRALREDPRAGVRELARRFERERRRAAAEAWRLRELHDTERTLRLAGVAPVAGLDEVGVGPLAGPVVAACVRLPGRLRLRGLRDSKQLSAEARERLAARLAEVALDLAIGHATRAEIDRLNILQATRLAMRRALVALRRAPALVLIDGRAVPDLDLPQRAIPRGDERVACIAAASIIAKVHRDRLMRALHPRYPRYGFARNMGYGTPEHLAALRRWGPCPAHRRSFAPVAQALRAAQRS
ncbi:MAG: ribonuclease HII [Myxococcota bacterium]